MLLRRQGKLSFATLRDRDGDVQLFVSSDVLGDDVHRDFDQLDRGDWVGVEGIVMTTRRGELSVKVGAFELLSKVVRPLPEKWHGLTDVDTRYRQRYVDLVVNDEARAFATCGSQTISPHPPLPRGARLRRGRGSHAAEHRRAARPRGRSSPTTTRSTSTSTSASRSSCT